MQTEHLHMWLRTWLDAAPDIDACDPQHAADAAADRLLEVLLDPDGPSEEELACARALAAAAAVSSLPSGWRSHLLPAPDGTPSPLTRALLAVTDTLTAALLVQEGPDAEALPALAERARRQTQPARVAG